MDLHRPTVKVLYVVLVVVTLIIGLACFIPPLWVMVSSLEPIKQFFSSNPSLVPTHLQFGEIKTVWEDNNFLRLYLNSAILTGGSLVVGVVFSAIFGFVLSRLKPVGSRLVFTLLIWTMMIPTTTAMVPVYQNIINFPILHIDLANSFIPLWLMAGANPFFVLVFKSFFDSIPMDLLEAGQLDGCSSLGLFRRIILPLSLPVVFTISIFSVIGSWSDFFWPYLVLTRTSLQPVMVGVYALSGLPENQQFIAVSLAMLPMIAVFLVLQRYIMGGLSIGGVKG